MPFLRPSVFFLPSLLFLFLFLFISPAYSGNVPEIQYFSETGRIDLKAEETPLQNITNAVGTVTGIKFIVPHNLNPSVTIEVENIPLERALNQLFRQALGSEKNAAMVYVAESGPDGKPRHVLMEVRVIRGEAPGAGSSSRPVTSPSSSPVVRSSSGTTNAGPSPEELAAIRAEKAEKRAERAKAREEKRKEKRKNSMAGKRGAGSKDPSASEQAAPEAGSGVTGNRGQGGRGK